MNGAFYLGIKALTQVEAIGRNLHPDLNFIQRGEPYARRLVEGKYKLPHVYEVINRLLSGSLDFLKSSQPIFRNFYERFRPESSAFPSSIRSMLKVLSRCVGRSIPSRT